MKFMLAVKINELLLPLNINNGSTYPLTIPDIHSGDQYIFHHLYFEAKKHI